VAHKAAMPITLTTCLGRKCERMEQPEREAGYLGVVELSAAELREIGREGTHRVSVLVVDDGGRTVFSDSATVRLERVAPNGEHCDPVCWHTSVTFR
jgi:hypothetical protein